MELKRQMGFGSYQTAWTWLHKIRKAMVAPEPPAAGRAGRGRRDLCRRPPAGRPGRGAAGKTRVAGAVESGRGQARGRRLGRLRLAVVPDVSARSLEAFSPPPSPRPRPWRPTAGPAMPASPPPATATSRSISAPPGATPRLRLPAIHLVFGLAKRWLLGTHHGAVSAKHLPAYLDEFVFRFNRRTAKSISHRFARLIEHAVQIQPTTYRTLVAKSA